MPPLMRNLNAWLFVLLLVPAVLSGCRRSSQPVAPYPHESVLSVVAELKIALRKDPYRQNPGRDLEGQNIYRVTLARLNNLEGLVDVAYEDLIEFARGQCYERLGRWQAAASAFETAALAGTSLSEEARTRQEWSEQLAALSAEPEGGSLKGYLNDLDSNIFNLRRLIEDAEPVYPYDAFILREIERLQSKKARVLFANRFVLPRGREDAVATAESMIEEHVSSRLFHEHRLMLGGFYEQLARDYESLNDPTTGDFDVQLWGDWVARARAEYTEVARADGDPAKPEGQARLRSLDAWAQRMLMQAR